MHSKGAVTYYNKITIYLFLVTYLFCQRVNVSVIQIWIRIFSNLFYISEKVTLNKYKT